MTSSSLCIVQIGTASLDDAIKIAMLREVPTLSLEAQIVQEYPKYKPAMLDGFSDKDAKTSNDFAAAWAARGGSELRDTARYI